MTDITWGDIVPLTTNNWLDLPDTVVPYYVDADEGHFLHRKNVLGRGLIRPKKNKPPRLQKVGNYHGAFEYLAEPLPAHITAQAISFFRRIKTTHNTEAEVIITKHEATGEFRLFVPWQRVSGGGVHSIYNPSHISRGWLVVGTMHSHPGSAFHSSTDEGDAREMDGMHLTVGFLDRPQPEVAAMVALGGTFFHFKDPQDVADLTNLDAATAPEWWDRYVMPRMVTDAERKTLAPWADDETWNKFMGRGPRKPEPVQHQPRQLPSRVPAYQYNPDTRSFKPAERLPDVFGISHDDLLFLTGDPEDYWETALGKEFVDSLYDTGLLNEDDLDDAIRFFPDSGDPSWWEKRMWDKVLDATNWLKDHGIKVTIKAEDKRPPKPVKGQTTMDEMASL